MSDSSFVTDMLKLIVEENLLGRLRWQIDGEDSPEISFWLDSSNVFDGFSESWEQVVPESLPVLKAAIAFCRSVDPDSGAAAGCDFWICAKHKTRPHKFPHSQDLWPLFNVCGKGKADE